MKYYNYPNGTEVATDIDSKNISDFAPGGGGGEAFIVTPVQSETSMVCDKTYKEIKDAMLAGKSVVFIFSFENATVISPIVVLGEVTDGKAVYVSGGEAAYNFTCSTENDYPTMEGEA